MANRLTRIFYPLLELLPEPTACKLKVLAQVLLRDYRFLNPSYHSYPHAAKFTNFPPEYADTEFRGLDPESRRIARDYLRRCRNINVLQNLPLPQELFLVHHSRLREHVILPPPETRQLRQTRRRFRLTGGAESLIFHQGVALLPESVKKRLAGTDFVDAGAYLGNYTIPLLQYNPRRIFAFEPSRISGNKLLANLSRASVPKGKVEWVQAGLATTERICRFADFGSGDQRLDQPGTEQIPLYRLDDFAVRRNLRLGLLKADVEGMGGSCSRGLWRPFAVTARYSPFRSTIHRRSSSGNTQSCGKRYPPTVIVSPTCRRAPDSNSHCSPGRKKLTTPTPSTGTEHMTRSCRQ